jgi:hypothetical protein
VTRTDREKERESASSRNCPACGKEKEQMNQLLIGIKTGYTNRLSEGRAVKNTAKDIERGYNGAEYYRNAFEKVRDTAKEGSSNFSVSLLVLINFD